MPNDAKSFHDCYVKTPMEWGMFTPYGNARIREFAAEMTYSIMRTFDYSNEAHDRECAIYMQFFKKWYDLRNDFRCEEASDTEVREIVWGFALKATLYRKCVDRAALDKVWYDAGSEAFGLFLEETVA